MNIYIDGFNLYFGMKAAGFEHCKWLDVYALGLLLKNEDHELHQVKYFTARINNNVPKFHRQKTYIEALETTPTILIFGQYLAEEVECPACHHVYSHSKEKMTDVNIAVHMLADAYKNSYDVALLISGDSDLVPAIREIRKDFPGKEVFVAFPPKRTSIELRLCAHSVFVIGKKKLERCQLPDELQNKYAFTIRKPAEWFSPS